MDAQGGRARVGDMGGEQDNRVNAMMSSAHGIDVEVEHGATFYRVEILNRLIIKCDCVSQHRSDIIGSDPPPQGVTGAAHAGAQREVNLVD